jgi:hypothetical protein
LSRQASERWFPIYGDAINISGFIPNGRNNGFIFAFRDADEIAADGVFSSRRATEVIRGRPVISSAEFRSLVSYSPRTERIYIDSAFGAFDYQVGNGVWILNNTKPFIDASSRFNPLGGVFTIRASAVQGRSFASNEHRMRIPRAPSAPNVRLNARTGRLAGVRTTMQWSHSPTGPFTSFTDRSGSLDSFRDFRRLRTGAGRSSFAVLRDADGNDYIAVYVRVAATDRLPPSPVQRVLVNTALLE